MTKQPAMNPLLVCALRRNCAVPVTATQLHEYVIALAQSEGWPTRSYAELKPQSIAAQLKGGHKRGEVDQGKEVKEGGRLVPTWRCLIKDSDAKAPIPQAPTNHRAPHPLQGMTTMQQFAVFDQMDRSLAVYATQNAELMDMLNRHTRQLHEHAAQVKRELMAAGVMESL